MDESCDKVEGVTAKKTPSLGLSVLSVTAILLVIIGGIAVLKVDFHVILLIAISLACLVTRQLGHSFDEIVQFMVNNLARAMSALFIFMMVGAIIGSWIKAGTIPALIYYGVNLISPSWLLPSGFVLCTIVSVCVGTSWGTVGTMGLVIMGIGSSLGIPAPLTAGCVISGALTGDKMSPISDTTNLAAVAAGATLYGHIKAMMLTTVPSWLICLVIYTVLGVQHGGATVDYAQVELTRSTLASSFNISVVMLLPIVVTLTLSLFKVSPLIAMFSGVAMAVLMGVIFQGAHWTEMFSAVNHGYSHDTGVKVVDKLLNRGGIQSMMWSVSLSFIIIALGGVLEGGGYLNVIVDALSRRISKAAHMVPVTILTAVFINISTSDSYSSIILTGTLYQKMFDKVGLARRMLSRCVEEGATLTIQLFPWTAAAAFYAGTLGVPTADYAPYAFLCFINPALSIGLAYLGIFLIFAKDAASSSLPDGARTDVPGGTDVS